MIVDTLKNLGLYAELDREVFAAMESFIAENDLKALAVGRHDILGERLYVNVSENRLDKPDSERKFESHRVYADLQLIIDGAERIYYADISALEAENEYDEKGDYILYVSDKGMAVDLDENGFAVFFPSDAHKPLCRADARAYSKKAVFKILL